MKYLLTLFAVIIALAMVQSARSSEITSARPGMLTPTPSPTPNLTPPSWEAELIPTVTPSLGNGATPTATPTSFPTTVTGTVIIEGGVCCIAAIAGSTLTVTSDLTATTDYGQVVEMRIKSNYAGCATASQMEQLPWQPFALEHTDEIIVPINWLGFYVTVQFKNNHGGVSSPVCDTIAIEGMPSQGTATPQAMR